MLSWLKGILLGLIMLLPGVSGGTAFVILGIYEDLVKDLAHFNIIPHLRLFAGILAGIFLGGFLFTFFFESYRDQAVVFLLGSMIASIRFVIRIDYKINKQLIGFFFIGVFFGYFLSAEPIGLSDYVEDINLLYLFTAAAIASAAMVVPGLPGSSVLIIMGVYQNIFYYLSGFMLLELLVFGAGSLLGMFLLVRLLDRLYTIFHQPLSYLFAGLILGSARALVPREINFSIIVLFLMGFMAVILLANKPKKDY